MESIRLIKKYGMKKYIRFYKYYKKKQKGFVTDSYLSYSSFYFPEDIGSTEIVEMKSGKQGIYKIFDLEYWDDFASGKIRKDFIGYENVKPIRECSLKEFLEIYTDYLK